MADRHLEVAVPWTRHPRTLCGESAVANVLTQNPRRVTCPHCALGLYG